MDEIMVGLDDLLPELEAEESPQAGSPTSTGPTIYLDSDDDESEIDLSAALSGLAVSDSPMASPADANAPVSSVDAAPDIRDVLAEMRASHTPEEQEAVALIQYEQAMLCLERGLVAEAVAELEAVATVPGLRFLAAARIGRVRIEAGDLAGGIDWLERAAEVPGPTHEEDAAVLYELADALELLGESARALAVLMELETTAGDYRDIRDRIAWLTRAQAGSDSE
jgi:tetratricopeptide (TPR) repeat protein